MTTPADATAPSRKFSLSSVSFLVALLLFLLPFVEIRCNGETFATNTGLGLAFGTGYKTTAPDKTLENTLEGTARRSRTEKQEGRMYPAALIALIAGIVGLVLSFTNSKPGKAGVFTGSVAAICLVILLIQIQSDVKSRPFTPGEDTLGNNLKVTAVFTAWYYLSLISFIAAAWLSYRRRPVVISG